MNYSYQKVTDDKVLFRFYNTVKEKIPYWFDVNYELWCQSMFRDTDYESITLFRDLETYAAYADADMVGFIQFGIPSYVYGQNGEKNYDVCSGIIRNLYFGAEHVKCGQELVKLAERYFAAHGVQQKYAFFHAFGMTCNAGHGKLYCTQSHIEQVLHACGYKKEHENVYYIKMLTKEVLISESDTEVRYAETNEKGLCGFTIFADNVYIGAGELVYLPQKTIAYLKWIYIENDFQHKDYASKALRLIFDGLFRQGINRIDTDTADGNLIAQKLYEKNGFENMGRTRSYLV